MRDILATAFPHAKRDGDGWAARCPAHDDQRASLSIGRGNDGRWLLHCHAGCELDAVLAASSLEHRDLFPEKPRERSRVIATYAYHDEHGTHLYDVLRYDPKDFRQRKADGTWSMKGVRRVLYRLPELQGQQTAYLVEGEKDCDRLRGLGLAVTTSVAGAGKWAPGYADQLVSAGVRQVVILPDNDDAGRAHAGQVATSCLVAGLKVKVVELPGMPAKGDVSDYLDAGHTVAELIVRVKATELSVPSGNGPSTASKLILTKLDSVQTETVDWVWQGRLARGKYTLGCGEPGVGKTYLFLDATARITRGGRWPDGTQAPVGNVLWLTAEDGIADTIKPRLEAMGADLSRVFILEGTTDAGGHRRMISLASDQAAVAEAVREVNPILVCIDPITAYLGSVDTHRDAEVRSTLAPLIDLAATQRFALAMIGHLSKDSQRAALHRPSGSIAFVAAARIVLAVAADPNCPERRLLAPIKGNLGKPPAALAYRITEAGSLAWETDPVATSDVASIFQAPNPVDREERGDAERVITDLLTEEGQWPLEAKRALEAGQAHGIPDRTMRYTAKRMGIRIEKVGFNGKWLWHRPEVASVAAMTPKAPNVAPSAPSWISSVEAANNNEEAIKTAFARARGEGARDADSDLF